MVGGWGNEIGSFFSISSRPLKMLINDSENIDCRSKSYIFRPF